VRQGTAASGDDKRFMRRALGAAQRAGRRDEIPVGAVLVCDGRVVASGGNRSIGGNDPTAHAEVVALRRAARILGNYRLVGSTLYVTLEPCLMCVGAMVHARVARVVYGASEPKAGALRSTLRFEALAVNHHFEIQAGVLEEESRLLLQSFFKERRARRRRAAADMG
jgi:tRNA(adenine34) deaminase